MSIESAPDQTASSLHKQVRHFQAWARRMPDEKRIAEWECDYLHWDKLYKAVFDFVAAHPLPIWNRRERAAVLYALARDWERRHIAYELRHRFPEVIVPLAHAAIAEGEPDARSQLAGELIKLNLPEGEIEPILLLLARNEDEYTRRRALDSLLRIGSSAVEELAIAAWDIADINQEWSRMMTLKCLYFIQSPQLEYYLSEAENDGRLHLGEYANKIRNGTANINE